MPSVSVTTGATALSRRKCSKVFSGASTAKGSYGTSVPVSSTLNLLTRVFRIGRGKPSVPPAFAEAIRASGPAGVEERRRRDGRAERTHRRGSDQAGLGGRAFCQSHVVSSII